MHIAYFTNSYYPVLNGVVRSVSSFRATLMNLGHNVFVFAGANSSYKDHEPFVFRYPSLPLPLAKIAAAIPVSPFVDQLLPALGLDVIHTHYPILLGQTAARKAAELNLPLVFTFHTQYWEYSQYEEYTHYIPFPQETIQEFLENTVDRWITDYLQKCQHVILPSESMKEIVVRKYGLKDRYSVIPTGINLEAFRRAEGTSLRAEQGWQDGLILISVGRLSPEKNWDTLLHAFAKIHHDRANARLVLVGDGPARQSLETQAEELGIAQWVTFTGALAFDEVPRYLKAADAFAFASATETQGLVTIEAMAAGLPIVAVDGGGTRDIVEHGKQGFLVDNDPDALADGLQRLLSDPEQMKRFSQNALEKASAFDVRALAKQMIAVYEQASQDKRENRFVSLDAEETTSTEAVSSIQT